MEVVAAYPLGGEGHPAHPALELGALLLEDDEARQAAALEGTGNRRSRAGEPKCLDEKVRVGRAEAGRALPCC